MFGESRRSFLARAAGASLALPTVLARTSLAIDPIGRTRPSHLKLSLAAYSYRQLFDGPNPKMDLFDYVSLAADMALDAVEPTSYWLPKDVDDDYLHRLSTHAVLLGLDISGTAIRNDFCLPTGAGRDADMAHVRAWIDRAAILGAPVIRVFGGTVPKGESNDVAIARVVEGFREILPYAASKGIVLALENHGGITATPEQLLGLVRAIDGPNFGVNLDTGNFHGDDPYADLAKLAPYAVNVQVKTEISRKGKPKEDADLARVVSILKESRYSGYVVLEYEAAEDPIKASPGHIKTLRSLIG